jgi:hypothetical protein
MFALVRRQLQISTIPQFRYLSPLTPQVYKAWTESKKIDPVTEQLANGAGAHWIGGKNADRIIVYYHGSSKISK